MKTIAKTNHYNFRYLITAIVLGLIVGLLAEPAMAQAPTKNKKNDKIPHGTLKEAKVIARIVSTVDEITPMRVKLNVLNPTGRSVRISILNYANLPVYEESFTGKEYNKILNFKSTAAGRYMLRISGHKQAEIRRFAIDVKTNRNLTSSEMENHSPSNVMAAIYNKEANKIVLHVVNNTGKPISYVLRNEGQEVLYRGIIKNNQFSKLFDLGESADGKYALEVNHQSQKASARTFALQTVYDRSFAWTDKRGRPLKPIVAQALNTQK
jgi:hypothetical protein